MTASVNSDDCGNASWEIRGLQATVDMDMHSLQVFSSVNAECFISLQSEISS